MGVGGQRHAPAALPPGKTRYPLYRRLGGPKGRYGRVREISPPPWFDRRTVHPVVSLRYPDPQTNVSGPPQYDISLYQRLLSCDMRTGRQTLNVRMWDLSFSWQYQNCSTLGGDAVQSCRSVSTFRKKLLPPSQRHRIAGCHFLLPSNHL